MAAKEFDENLNELEKLAGFESVTKLNIEKETGEVFPIQERQSSEIPVSAFAESGYSDFMAQWKKKLAADDVSS